MFQYYRPKKSKVVISEVEVLNAENDTCMGLIIFMQHCVNSLMLDLLDARCVVREV